MKWTAPLRPVLKVGDTLIDRLLCVFGAVLFCQLPEFIQQYLQRLGGRLDEARRQLAQFTEVAAQSKLTLAEFITRTGHNADESVARLAGVMSDAVTRVDSLAAADLAIRNASLWEKPFVFFAHLDPSITHATLSIYKPAVPTTIEGLIYAVLGMLVILGLYHGLIRYPIMKAAKPRPTPPAPAATLG
ncbi:MAG: DUF2937 family protein [Opitutaceae bacterium]|jgi:hypothetical protein